MTKQPNWKFIANLGDASPLTDGGYFIYEDSTGIYPPEGERFDADSLEVHRFSLDKCELYEGHIIPFGFGARTDLPHPTSDYVEWFDADLAGVASFAGITREDLAGWFASADIILRARAYELIGEYHGFENLDGYPLQLTRKEAAKRYKEEVKK
jgi:hypothetical protein